MVMVVVKGAQVSCGGGGECECVGSCLQEMVSIGNRPHPVRE